MIRDLKKKKKHPVGKEEKFQQHRRTFKEKYKVKNHSGSKHCYTEDNSKEKKFPWKKRDPTGTRMKKITRMRGVQ